MPLIDEFDSTFRSAREFTAAEAFQPVMPMRTRERRRVRWSAALAVIVLGVLGFASYKFVSGVGHDRHSAAVTTPRPARSQPAVAGTANAATSAPAATPSATPSPTSSPSPTPVAAKVLTPASVAAFGPAGTADGDNAATATRALSGDAATPWYSDWYAAPDINGQPGTGLLLDMGRTVTITSVRLSLGASKGAGLQLRAGATPVLASLREVATSTGAGGTVQLSLSSPVQARYLLIWFTTLPPDTSGTYQATVYDITVKGQS